MSTKVIRLMEPDPTFTIADLRRNESHHPKPAQPQTSQNEPFRKNREHLNKELRNQVFPKNLVSGLLVI
ncbi:MAG: hypothetical protein EBE86_025760 [Hormoscilla sp. GUM202]|nr:hypothetical protein [Hormoscilla sp. GUM202]